MFSQSGETRQDNDLVALRGASVCTGSDEKSVRRAVVSHSKPCSTAGLGRRRTRCRWALLHTFGVLLSLGRAIDGVNRPAPQGTGAQDSCLNLRRPFSLIHSVDMDGVGVAGGPIGVIGLKIG